MIVICKFRISSTASLVSIPFQFQSDLRQKKKMEMGGGVQSEKGDTQKLGNPRLLRLINPRTL